MPEISRFYGIVIEMFFNDHSPPHFHAEYQGAQAQYDIRTLKLRKGKLPKKAHNLIVEWATEHQNELMRNWELASQLKPISKIEPL